MMLVDPKSIIKRLTRPCTAALEAAVNQCVTARHYEVTLEHVMLALLDNADSDLAFLVMHYDLDPARLRQTLQRAMHNIESVLPPDAGDPPPVFPPVLRSHGSEARARGPEERVGMVR